MSSRTVVDPRFPSRLRELRTERGLSLRALANRAYCSKSTVSELENGHKTPSRHIVEHLDRVLGAGGELAGLVTETSYTPGTRPVQIENGAEGVTLVDVVAEPGRPLDVDDVAHLRQVISQLVALDNAYGGDDTHRLAVRVFRSAGRKLACGAYTSAVETDLQAAVGEVGELAAWLLYDSDRQDDSRRINIEAMTVTRLAGDRMIELLELANLAMQSVHLRRGREALRIAEHVLDSDRLSPRVAGLFHLRRGRALAELGDRPRALAALDQARALIGDGTTHQDPPWAWWVDDNELTWHSAMLHADLGEHHQAADLFRSTTVGYPPVKRRGHYNNLAHLLDALTTVGAWSDSEPVMQEVVPFVDEIGSTRTEHLLARVTARIGRARAPDSLDDLTNVLASRLSAVR